MYAASTNMNRSDSGHHESKHKMKNKRSMKDKLRAVLNGNKGTTQEQGLERKRGEMDSENEVDDLEVQVARYKPESLDSLCKTTKFTKKELQIMYRGFKQECPSGIVNEDTFKQIYGQFFPQGDSNAYAHFVFNAFDKDKNGSISFDEFVRALSMLCRGSMEEKLHWAFSLYDINGDGVVTKEEFTEVVSAIYDMMGKSTDPAVDESTVQEHVNNIYQSVDDINTPLTEEEFINLCYRDHFLLKSSFLVFDTDLRINDQPQVVEP